MTDTTNYRIGGVLDQAIRSVSLENPKTPLSSMDESHLHLFGGSASSAGPVVSERSAMGNTVVYRCVFLIASTIASLPLAPFARLEPRGSRAATEHPAYDLLHVSPNPEMTPLVVREIVLALALLQGNGYAAIIRDGAGRPVELWPLHPKDVRVGRINGRKSYLVTVDGKTDYWPDEYILHVPGLGFDGLAGFSVLQMLRQSLGLAIAAEEYGSRFFSNGAPPGVVLEVPKKLTDPAFERLKKSWNDAHQGVANAHRTAILEDGVKVNRFAIPPEDAQFMETRKFQAIEICRFFGVPPHMLAELERSTNNNIEHQGLEFEKYGLRRWITIMEQECNRKLLTPDERRTMYCKHNVKGILRGDIAARYQAYATARQWGWMSANDVLELEDENPLPGEQGDIYLVPANMQSAALVAAGKPADGQDDPPAAPPRRMMPIWVDALERIARRERQVMPKLAAGDEGAIKDHKIYVRSILAPLCAACDQSADAMTDRYIASRAAAWHAAPAADTLATTLELPQ